VGAQGHIKWGQDPRRKGGHFGSQTLTIARRRYPQRCSLGGRSDAVSGVYRNSLLLFHVRSRRVFAAENDREMALPPITA